MQTLAAFNLAAKLTAPFQPNEPNVYVVSFCVSCLEIVRKHNTCCSVT